MNWLQTLDRPVPQVQVSINVYEMNENDFKELGIDYVAWKNGPGAQLFGAGTHGDAGLGPVLHHRFRQHAG